MVLLMGFCLKAAPEPTPVPHVAAVITVDEEALGGGPGLAHQVHLPEGSMMADFVARFEGLSLSAPATFAQGGDASVSGDATASGDAGVQDDLPIAGPATEPPPRARPPIRRPPVTPPWRLGDDTSVMEPLRKQRRQNKIASEPHPPDYPPPGLASASEASAPSAPHGSDTFVPATSKGSAPVPPPPARAAPAPAQAVPATAPAAAPLHQQLPHQQSQQLHQQLPHLPSASAASAEPAPEPPGPDVPLQPGTNVPRADVVADRWLARARLEGRHLIVHHDDLSPQFDWEDPVMCLARNSLDVVIGAYDESMFGLHVSWARGRDSSRLSHIRAHTT